MALLFSMDILAWLARISLLCLKHDYSSSSVTWPSLELLTGLPPVKVYSSTVNGRVCEALTVLGWLWAAGSAAPGWRPEVSWGAHTAVWHGCPSSPAPRCCDRWAALTTLWCAVPWCSLPSHTHTDTVTSLINISVNDPQLINGLDADKGVRSRNALIVWFNISIDALINKVEFTNIG